MFHKVIFQNSFWSLMWNDPGISASFSQFFYTYEKPIGWTVVTQLNIKVYKIYQHQKIMLEQIIILNQIQPSEDHVNIHIYCSSPTFQVNHFSYLGKIKNKSKPYFPNRVTYSFRQFYYKPSTTVKKVLGNGDHHLMFPCISTLFSFSCSSFVTFIFDLSTEKLVWTS